MNEALLPPSASTRAAAFDQLWEAVTGLSLIALLFLVVLVAYCVIQRRRRSPDETPDPDGNPPFLQLGWSAPVFALALVLFYFGATGFTDAKTPTDAYVIRVEASSDGWSFLYPNDYIGEELHVPTETPVRLVMSTIDGVPRRLSLPALRVQQAIVPGRYTELSFEATKASVFPMLCTANCPAETASQTITVHTPSAFKAWMDDASNWIDKLPPEQAGQRLFAEATCAACHSVDGSKMVGPSFKGLWQRKSPMTGGGFKVADAAYIKNSILNPKADIVKGYEPVMPSFQGRLGDKEIDVIIAYIKTLE